MDTESFVHRAIDKFVSRASAYGQTLPAEGKMVHGLPGLPVAKTQRQFVCPECEENFFQDAEALGRHIVRHEPFRLMEELKEPVRCPKCTRWLEGAKDELGESGEAAWHMRLCQGDGPLGLDMVPRRESPLRQ